jgi:hypothetical protein
MGVWKHEFNQSQCTIGAGNLSQNIGKSLLLIFIPFKKVMVENG